MTKLKITDIDIKNKKLLIRVDFNVPLHNDGSISDITRIKESLPTIKYALDGGARVILMSHMGRPEGKKNPKYSLSICAKALSDLLKVNVKMAPDCIGMQTETMAKELKTHEILLLENLRFYAAEEHPELDRSFAHKLSQLGDVYVNDAFATAHRKHSSTASIAEYFPQRSVMGLLMQKEIDALSYLLKNPIRPFAAIVGGAKISTKIGVLHSLAMKADQLFIGGGMTYTFMKAKGLSIGSSIYDETSLEYAESFIRLCKDRSIPFYLPEDLVIRHTESGDIQIIDLDKGIPENWEGMDIGPKTCSAWEKLLSQAKTIFWNGPLGVFEIKPFEKGTKAIAEAIAKLDLVKSFVGGGDSIAAIEQLQLNKKFTHLSTGGGASLEYIEYGTLPGIEALSDKKS